MKNISLLLATGAMMLASCTETANFSGNVSGCNSDTIMVFTADVSTGKWINVDTFALKNGYFETHIADTALLEVSISAKRKFGTHEAQVIGESFLFFPGDQMKIEGKLPYALTASGTALYDDLAKQTDLVAVNTALSELEDRTSVLDDEKDAALLDSLDRVYDQLLEKKNQLQFEIIKRQPNTILAGYLSQSLNVKEGVEAMSILSDDVKNGLMSECIKSVAEEYKRDLSIEQAKERMTAGAIAPQFSLKDLEGKVRTSNDFKGKYMVLDFWGTWCGWCIAGIPEMKNYYKKYKNQIEFVSICTNDTDEKWRKAVDKYKLPWVNLFAPEDSDILLNFAVSCFPTKIIIDAEGKIVEVFEGESEEFYNKLDELFQ